MKILSHSESETFAIGRDIGAKASPGTVICLFGDLGAGKTTLVKGIAESIGVNPNWVSSPTFVYLNQYEGEIPLYHFDLYRLQGAEQFLSMGFDEYLFGDGIVCMEWSERIEELLPEGRTRVYLKHLGDCLREIEIQGEEG